MATERSAGCPATHKGLKCHRDAGHPGMHVAFDTIRAFPVYERVTRFWR